jgi:3-methylcrotonyl-CoA carboxylase alpha subunit
MPVLRFSGETYDMTISGAGHGAWLRYGGDCHEGKMDPVGDGSYRVTLDGQTQRVWLVISKDRVFMHAYGRHWELELVVSDATDSGAAEGPENIAQASMPGVILRVAVEQGQVVAEGQSLLTMESMKLQTTIAAWRDGTVDQIYVDEGDTVEKGSALIRLAKEDGQI